MRQPRRDPAARRTTRVVVRQVLRAGQLESEAQQAADEGEGPPEEPERERRPGSKAPIIRAVGYAHGVRVVVRCFLVIAPRRRVRGHRRCDDPAGAALVADGDAIPRNASVHRIMRIGGGRLEEHRQAGQERCSQTPEDSHDRRD